MTHRTVHISKAGTMQCTLLHLRSSKESPKSTIKLEWGKPFFWHSPTVPSARSWGRESCKEVQEGQALHSHHFLHVSKNLTQIKMSLCLSISSLEQITLTETSQQHKLTEQASSSPRQSGVGEGSHIKNQVSIYIYMGA